LFARPVRSQQPDLVRDVNRVGSGDQRTVRRDRDWLVGAVEPQCLEPPWGPACERNRLDNLVPVRPDHAIRDLTAVRPPDRPTAAFAQTPPFRAVGTGDEYTGVVATIRREREPAAVRRP